MEQGIIGKDIWKAKAILDEGGIVGMPTETVYGLAANALDEQAVLKIFKAKNRPFFDPLIVHVADMQRLRELVKSIPKELEGLMEAYMPGPLTMLLPKVDLVPGLVTSGSEMLALRIPKHPMALRLLEVLDYPLAAPSANPFGYISPTRPSHVVAQLGDVVPYILDGGICKVGVESTIVGMQDGALVIYRYGGLAEEAIANEMGGIAIVSAKKAKQVMPGGLESHYAPKKTFIVHADEAAFASTMNAEPENAYLSFGPRHYAATGAQHVLNLSEKGDVDEAALQLFDNMRRLDDLEQVRTIHAVYVPDEGLGKAVNDRLRRAALK
jgi:L-threonylcarbamoyladenylate synthase